MQSPNQASRPPLVVILGPTAVGKTELSLQLAERLGGEIISADSRLFYRGMDIGTAKPTPEERRRVPHHMIDIADPDRTWSLAQFQQETLKIIPQILQRGNLPMLVGGSGQYIRAILEGWQIPESRPDPQLRQALDAWAGEIGGEGLHARLAVLDPGAAAKIDPRNVRRTVRALEVIFHTGRRFSDQRRRGPSPYRNLQIGLMRPRAALYERIDNRIDAMITAGLVEEVRGLLARGYPPDLPTLSAIGYREIIAHLNGEISLEEAVIQIRRATRTFVRRQANWFKMDDPHIHWFQVEQGVRQQIENRISNWLAAAGMD